MLRYKIWHHLDMLISLGSGKSLQEEFVPGRCRRLALPLQVMQISSLKLL